MRVTSTEIKMAFLNKVRSLPLPPVRNILNVALQTARQTIPDKPNKSDYEQPQGPPPPIPPRPQNVRFADQPNGILYTQCVTEQI